MFQLTLPGEFAPVIESPLAFYLVRLLERQPANLRPLTEVREGIVYRVGREKEQAQQEDIFARAMQGRSVRINQSLLDRIPGVSPHPALPAGPVARTTPIRTDQ